VNRIVFVAVGMAVVGSCLSASSITCSYNGAASTSSCYGTPGVSVASNDTLSFYAFGSATQAPLDVSSPASATTVGGVGVQVSLGPGGVMPGGMVVPSSGDHHVTRFDNSQVIYVTDGQGSFGWDVSGDPSVLNDPAFFQYAGHFDGPSAPVLSTEAAGGWGAFLLGPTNASGLTTSDQMVFTFDRPLSGAGFLISTVSNGAANTNFTAEVDAYNGNILLGTYVIQASGLGGICASLQNFSTPVPCNDAPFIGFSDPNNTITKLVVDAFDATGNHGFFLNDFVAQYNGSIGQPAPEPALFGFTGLCLTALGFASKRRGSSK